MDNKFQMVAKTFQGLEDVLRDELIGIGAENVEPGLRMVSFEGDLEVMYKANLCCRTALSVLRPVAKFTAADTDELYDIVRDIDWSKYMSADQTFSIDSTVNSQDFPHSKYVVYRVKDGIVDHFFDKEGRRPSIRLTGADRQFNVHIADRRVTISLNSSGEPLNQRGYRVASTQAPINEVLAAGIIMKTGWRGDSNFVDPMCGSGTFLIEAALIARNVNPGIFRKNFAFEKWDDFDPDLFERLYNDDSQERDFDYRIYGGDIDPEAVSVARKNIKVAGADSIIELVCKPFEEWTDAPQPGILITNPPYGERLRPDNIDSLYHRIGTTLKRQFKGYHAWILGYRDEQFAEIGLRPSVKFPILNGSLECSLREYVLFDGTMDDFKANGGVTINEDFNRDVRPRVRHVSDREWKEESSRFEGRRERRPRREEDRERRPRKGDDRERPRRHDDRDKKPRRDNDRDFKPRKPKGAIRVPDKGPRIDASREVRFSDVPIRSRRGWRKKEDSENSES